MATQKEIADHLFMTDRNVRILIQKKILSPSESLESAREKYILYMREQAAGRTDENGGTGLVEERTRLAKEQADNVSLKNRILRKELLYRADVDNAVKASFARVRSKLLSIPSKLKRDRRECEQYVIEALEELANTNLEIEISREALTNIDVENED